MPAKGLVTLSREGNRLRLNTDKTEIRESIEKLLTFTTRRTLVGYEKRMHGGRSVLLERANAYNLDHAGRLCTSFGFYKKIQEHLEKEGYDSRIEKYEHPVLEPNWDRLFEPRLNTVLRHKQDDFLVTAASCISNWLPGRFDCPPAFGKSKCIGFICLLYPRARIHVVSKRVPVLRNRIYPELAQMIPNVGIVGGGLKINDRRVQLYTVDSLNHSTGNADILIVDECHEACSDVSASELAKYDRSVNFGLSATHDMRIDGKDFRAEALFGPIVFEMGYEEAKQHGMVSPIRVYWREVNLPMDPCDGITDLAEKKRWGIWRNEYRNNMIAEDARRYGNDEQVLITCEVIEHALNLKKLLPEFELVYSENGVKPSDQKYFDRMGIWPKGETPMTRERRDKLTSDFEKGRAKKVIATTVWNVGVDFRQLAVLIRGDAGGSPIMDTQIPGRTSRLHADKDYGIVHDYRDNFNNGFKLKSGNRRTNYDKNNWLQLEFNAKGIAL